MYTVFQIKNTIDGKIYVGYTRYNIGHRLETLKTISQINYRPLAIRVAIAAYGWDSFKCEVLTHKQKSSDFNEIFYPIQELHMYPKGYNLGDENKNSYLNRKYLSDKHPPEIAKILRSIIISGIESRYPDPPDLLNVREISNYFPSIMGAAMSDYSATNQYLINKWHVNPVIVCRAPFFRTHDLQEVEDAITAGRPYVAGRYLDE